MPRPLKRGIIDASTIILSKGINKYAFMCGSNFYESDVTLKLKPFGVLPSIVIEVRRFFTGITMSIDAKMSNVLSLKIVKCKKHKTRSTLKVETQ
jgi:hypothetical protein